MLLFVVVFVDEMKVEEENVVEYLMPRRLKCIEYGWTEQATHLSPPRRRKQDGPFCEGRMS